MLTVAESASGSERPGVASSRVALGPLEPGQIVPPRRSGAREGADISERCSVSVAPVAVRLFAEIPPADNYSGDTRAAAQTCSRPMSHREH